ncbi:urease subunit beta, partial [Staphylococcus epidermidis]
VQLVEYSGRRKIYPFPALLDGDIDEQPLFPPNHSNQNPPLKNDPPQHNPNKKPPK